MWLRHRHRHVFVHCVRDSAPQPLRYGFFSPDLEAARAFHRRYDGHYGDEWEHAFPERLPLVVWLHGAGEGGSDPKVTYTGNKVVALSTPEIQRRLGGAAYVLTPQAPTFWLDNGAEDPRTHENLTDCNSRYTEALMRASTSLWRRIPTSTATASIWADAPTAASWS